MGEVFVSFAVWLLHFIDEADGYDNWFLRRPTWSLVDAVVLDCDSRGKITVIFHRRASLAPDEALIASGL